MLDKKSFDDGDERYFQHTQIVSLNSFILFQFILQVDKLVESDLEFWSFRRKRDYLLPILTQICSPVLFDHELN